MTAEGEQRESIAVWLKRERHAQLDPATGKPWTAEGLADALAALGIRVKPVYIRQYETVSEPGQDILDGLGKVLNSTPPPKQRGWAARRRVRERGGTMEPDVAEHLRVLGEIQARQTDVLNGVQANQEKLSDQILLGNATLMKAMTELADAVAAVARAVGVLNGTVPAAPDAATQETPATPRRKRSGSKDAGTAGP